MIDEIKTRFENVMIIDDTDTDLYITSRIISKNNFGKILLKYSSGIEALQYLKDNEENIEALPQVIFVDIYMPMMSGFEFMNEYDKLSPALKAHCKAYIISSTINEKDITRARNDKNVIDFHEKPITKQFLENICPN